MQVKRYEVQTIRDAMERIKQDLGPEAVILSTRRLDGQKGKAAFEVIAARDIDYSEISEKAKTVERSGGGIEVAEKDDEREKDNESVSLLRQEIDELKNLIKEIRDREVLWGEAAELRDGLDALFDSLAPRQNQKVSPVLSKIYHQLVTKGISKRRAFLLMNDLNNEKFLPEDGSGYLSVFRNIEKRIQEEIASSCSCKDTGKKRISAFIGPTGAGKTTTLAKLAAHCRFQQKKNVGIVSADTYRIGATEQLKIYADIMDVPLEIATEKEKLKDVIRKFADKDIILIDTPGKNCNDTQYILQLKELLAADASMEKNLILSMTASEENMIDTASQFSIIQYDTVIFTKMDEVRNFGSIYNMIAYTGKPVPYVTNGQNVPQDIERVDSRKLARLIVAGGTH